MAGKRRHVPGLPGREDDLPQGVARLLQLGPRGGADLEGKLPRLDEDGLLLHTVELERQRLPGPDEENLPRVPAGAGKQQLVTPRLGNAAHADRLVPTRVVLS